MQNVPKIVSERLRAAPPAVNHPDADVLTAFAERSLPDRERGVVLEHLARCGDCRDVIALALPATEAIETATIPARSGGLTWPVLRWAFVTAGVLAIGAFGIMQYQRRQASTTAFNKGSQYQGQAATTEARNQPTPPPPASSEARDKAPTASGAAADTRSATRTAPVPVEPRQMARIEPPARTHAPQSFGQSVGAAIGGPIHGGPNASQAWQQQTQSQGQQLGKPAAPAISRNQSADLAQSSPTPPISQTVEVTGEAPTINTSEAQLSSTQTQPSSLDDSARIRVDKAKPPVTVETENGSPSQGERGAAVQQQDLPVQAGSPGLNGRNFTQLIALSGPLPLWTISSTGTLQRSFDQGHTWQDVRVVSNSSVADATSLQAAAKTSRSKEREKDVDKKTLSVSAAPPIFRAVAASGADVWAGGSNSSLYHSLDAGGHWARVVPSSSGDALTGDIVSLEFSDPQHGTVTTSTPEIWTTGDGGQTWQKR